MNHFKIIILAIYAFTTLLMSCHKEETYYCYLIQKEWPYEADTLQSYDESFWFWNRRSKPEDECKLDQADLIIQHQYELDDISFDCDCGWEPY